MPSAEKFNIVQFYLDICHQHKIGAYEHNQDIWVEFGRLSNLEDKTKLMLARQVEDYVQSGNLHN